MRGVKVRAYRAFAGCVVTALLAAGAGLGSQGCGDDGGSDGAGAAGGGNGTAGGGNEGGNGDGGGPRTVILHPNAQPLPGERECVVEITTNIPTIPANHVPVCTQVEYSTDPPTWGDHWLFWVAFKKYTNPVPPQMYVHNHEHGGVVLSYRCPGGCPDVLAMLEDVYDQVPEDPLCSKIPGASTSRMLLAPEPNAPAPIVASSWNATYKATCIDSESLTNFVSDVYGRGPETLCNAGVDLEDPSEGYLDCGAGGGGGGGG